MTLYGGMHHQKVRRRGSTSIGGGVWRKERKRAPALNMSFHQLVSHQGFTYLIQYHTNIQLNSYKPILCNIKQILYTRRGHLTYSVMSPHILSVIYHVMWYVKWLIDWYYYVICYGVQYYTLPVPTRKKLWQRKSIYPASQIQILKRMKYNLFSNFLNFLSANCVGPRQPSPTSQAGETFVFINHSKE